MRKHCLIGRRFTRLLVVGTGPPNPDRHGTAICICDCGKQTTVTNSKLLSGHTRSCGCLAGKGNPPPEYAKPVPKTHGACTGHKKTAAYKTWIRIKLRCLNPKRKDFPRYGGRGITVCERWKNSFENFLADMGEQPRGKTLDRINNNEGYEPGNCRWATASEQQRNKRTNVVITVAGFTGCLTEVAERFGANPQTVRDRLLRGWSPEDAVLRPKMKHRNDATPAFAQTLLPGI